jgi:hypothetical protein
MILAISPHNPLRAPLMPAAFRFATLMS